MFSTKPPLVNEPPTVVYILPTSEAMAPFRGRIMPAGFDYRDVIQSVGLTPHIFGYGFDEIDNSFYEMYFDDLAESAFESSQRDGLDADMYAHNAVTALADCAIEMCLALGDTIKRFIPDDGEFYVEHLNIDSSDNIHLVCVPVKPHYVEEGE